MHTVAQTSPLVNTLAFVQSECCLADVSDIKGFTVCRHCWHRCDVEE